MMKVYGPAILAAQGLIGQFIPKFLQPTVEKLAEVRRHPPALPFLTRGEDFIDRMGPYGLEIRAGAAQFNFSLGEAILLNYIYEVR